jgi:hypothetical protein
MLLALYQPLHWHVDDSKEEPNKQTCHGGGGEGVDLRGVVAAA